MQKNKIVSIELLRIICALFVVCIHVFMAYLNLPGVFPYKVIFAESFMRSCVNCFFMITGFVLFTKKRSVWKVAKSVFFGIILPSFLLMYFLQIFNDWFSSVGTIAECIEKWQIDRGFFYSQILGWKSGMLNSFYFWYVFALVEVYVWYPLLRYLCVDTKEAAKIRRYLIAVWLLAYTVLPSIINVYNNFGWGTVTMKSPLSMFAGYLLIGYEFYLFYEKGVIRAEKKQLALYSFLYIAGSLLTFGLSWYEIQLDQVFDQLFYDYYNFGVVISGFGLFLLVLCVRISSPRLQNVICYIGDKTFLIYLVHWLVIRKLFTLKITEQIREKTGATLFYPVHVALCFSLSLLIAIAVKETKNGIVKIWKKLPALRKVK